MLSTAGGKEMSATTSQSVSEPSRFAAILPRRISPSGLVDYRQCPRKLRFKYVEKIQPVRRPSPVLMLGNAIHGALDKFFGLPLEEREPAAEVLHRCLRAVWRDHRKADTFCSVEEEADYGRQCLALLDTFASRFDTTARPLVRERWVSFRLPNGVELFGKIDRIDLMALENGPDRLEVIDYKTGRQILDDDEVGKEPAAQVYLLAAEELYQRPVDRVRYLYLLHGQDARWMPEREDVDAARDGLVTETDRIYRDLALTACPGEHCRFCEFAHVCPDANRVTLADLSVDPTLPF